MIRLIHSPNPKSRLVGIIFFSVRPSVPTFQILQNKITENNVRYTDMTMGLAEWIIDDTCLVCSTFFKYLIIAIIDAYCYHMWSWTWHFFQFRKVMTIPFSVHTTYKEELSFSDDSLEVELQQHPLEEQQIHNGQEYFIYLIFYPPGPGQ